MLAVAPNGGRKTKADHPALPLSADELARTAAECLERGASMIHLHVRDAEGEHCLDPEAYRATIAHICQEVGDRLVLQITSESLGRYSPAEQRAAVLKTNPEAVSLALQRARPGGAGREGLLRLPRQAQADARLAADHPLHAERCGAPGRDGETGAHPLRQALRPLCARAVFAHPHRPAARPPAVPRARHAPVPSWSVCAFGRRETACVTAAALLGGHARVGFENNLTLPDGARAGSNADLVGAAARALEAVGLAPQTADSLREEIAEALGP